MGTYLPAGVNLPQALWFLNENETSEDSFTFNAQWAVSPYESLPAFFFLVTVLLAVVSQTQLLF